MAFRHLERFVNGALKPITERKKIPHHMKIPLSFEERVARIIGSREFSRLAEEAGLESFEEADDFEVEDGPENPRTIYEEDPEFATYRSVERGLTKDFDRGPAEEATERVKRKFGRKKGSDSDPKPVHSAGPESDPA